MKKFALLGRCLVLLLITPWVLLAATYRIVAALLRFPRRLLLATASTLRCPVGHPNPVMGRWTCACGATFLGHVFAPCPVCRLPAGWMCCKICGLSIRSPWKGP